MSTRLFWFRHDLRVHDQPALRLAAGPGTRHLLPVVCVPEAPPLTPWGFARRGPHPRAWWGAAVRALGRELQARGCPLLVCAGPATRVLPALARAIGAEAIVCEEIAAPEEQDEVAALRAAGLRLHTVWQSSLLDPAALPWPVQALPQVFSRFRVALERAGLQPPAPLPAPERLPPWPSAPLPPGCGMPAALWAGPSAPAPCAHSSFPYPLDGGEAGEAGALAHLARYGARGLPARYKQTRDALRGADFSSHCAPWLATGALSVRRLLAWLRAHEAEHGASDGSQWLWFELLWRDYFRFLHLQQGRLLYRARGLGPDRPTPHDAAAFAAWCAGRCGQPLVDAGMRELARTGYLSNRMRQLCASHLVHGLGGDWRAGAAWFEACLIDYDVYSNQGNWLYLAGRGTDPRGGRRFDLAWQAARHDPDGAYQRLWSPA